MKDHEILRLAYADPQGVCERFILNVLTRMNNELFTTFDLSDFKLETEVKTSDEEDVGRVEMSIQSLKDMRYFFRYFKKIIKK